MDIERLIGVEVETIEGVPIGEIVGIELFGAKMRLIIASEFDFENGGPDDDGGLPLETEQEGQRDLFDHQLGENVLRFRQTG